MPDEATLAKTMNSADKSFNLVNKEINFPSLNCRSFNLMTKVSGVVYFNFEVAQTLYSLLLYSPLEACSYMGIDSGASPIYVTNINHFVLS